MERKFLTKTARTQWQSIKFFRDPFRLIPVNELADIADKFTRNAIMSSNEFRQVIGMKPADDPNADKLINNNMPQSEIPGMGDADNAELDEDQGIDPMDQPVSNL
jgi:hypothetical protein